MLFLKSVASEALLFVCLLKVLGLGHCCDCSQGEDEEEVDVYSSLLEQHSSESPTLVSEVTLQEIDDDHGKEVCDCVPYYMCKNGTNTFNEDGAGIIDIRIPEDDKCHYLEVCCAAPGLIPPEEVTLKPVPPTTFSVCGNHHPEGVGFRITGDHSEANYGEFPWITAIIRRDHVSDDVFIEVMECGGSIIHPQVVLTAAHCVKQKTDLFIRAGEWDTQTVNEPYPTQDRNVTQVIIHEKYYGGALWNDVALLVLETPLELSEVVGTICLPEQGEDMDGRTCLVSGWGKDVFGKEGKYQVILKKVEQPVVPFAKCEAELRKTRLKERFKLHESFLCAGGEVGKDACKGDGGSPLVCPSKDNPKQYVQAGIVAWGIGCGTEVPAVYAKVPHFRTWIERKIASLKLL